MFKFNCKLTEDDYIKFNMYWALNSKSQKINFIILKFLVPIVFILFSLIAFPAMTKNYIVLYFIIFLVASIYWVLNYNKILYKQFKNYIKKLKKDGKLPYDENSTYDFYEDKFVAITDEKEATIKYETIEKLHISIDGIYIFINSIEAIILPENVFKDIKQKEKFINFINAKINVK